MKPFILILLTSFFAVSCDKQEILPAGKYCGDIDTFVQAHFPGSPVLQVIEDRDDLRKTYIASLQGGAVLEFDRRCDIIEMEAPFGLPASAIPAKVWDFTEKNYPANFIVSWELDDRGQQVDLDNGIGLEFTKGGDFLRIDN